MPDQPDNSFLAQQLALANAAPGEKEMALSEAEHANTLLPTADPLSGPTREEVLALIQMMIVDSSNSISTLSRLLQTPYISWPYGPVPATPAVLRLDPIWDPLRADPAFQKLCEERKNNLTQNRWLTPIASATVARVHPKSAIPPLQLFNASTV